MDDQNTVKPISECRMYEKKFPEMNDLVVVNIKKISEMGVYVQLLEYDNLEGMVLLSELSRKRFRSIHRLIRVGRNEVVVVIKVDESKGYIDLSKRRVSPKDIIKCETQFNMAKAAHRIVRQVAERESIPIIDLYSKYIWPLSKIYGSNYNVCLKIIECPEEVFSKLPDIPEQVKNEFIHAVTTRLIPPKHKIRSDIEVTCIQETGINSIKKALQAGVDIQTDDISISIKLVAPPLYVMSAICTDKEAGLALLNDAIKEIERVIIEENGMIDIKMKPKLIGDVDEMVLQARMLQAEMENAEVDGDSDENDEQAWDENL